jgi:hypothetical protein
MSHVDYEGMLAVRGVLIDDQRDEIGQLKAAAKRLRNELETFKNRFLPTPCEARRFIDRILEEQTLKP